MKLTELNPRWYRLVEEGPVVGISFECPHCRVQRLGVVFHHRGREAIEDSVIHAESPTTNHIWTLDGDSFENLTLNPSIDASASGHWHGFINAGQIS